jgi:hypothetical protein
MNGCVNQAGPSPANRLVEKCAQWPAYGAGKTAIEGDRDDRASRSAAVETPERRECRFIQAGAHPQADRAPTQQIENEIGGQSYAGQSNRKNKRAGHQYRATAVALDRPPDERRRKAAA